MFEIETLDYSDVAKTIDHSLLRPELDTETVLEGIRLALRYDVASATVRPADVADGRSARRGVGRDDLDRGRLSARQSHDGDERVRDGGADPGRRA